METILIAEDDPFQREVLVRLLEKKLDYRVIAAESGRQVIDQLRLKNVGDINAVLLDIFMPDMDGFETLKEIRRLRPDIPVLMLTGSDDISMAVRAIREGATDFIVKPPEPVHLNVALKNAIKLSSLSRELAKLKRDKQGAFTFSDLIGHDSGLIQAVTIGQKAASCDVPVLITGETGVGKELFARAIHGESKRSGESFIALNCGAIPENLVESVLFGHEKGAFTGAVNRTIGKFREAESGTIFLDEIGELPLEAQVKLLRALQQKEVEPVGAGKPVKVNVRIVSATNRDLRAEVKAGRFREDLYFRLNVLPVHVPPLRTRQQDILPLAEHFMERLAASDSLAIKILGADAKTYLKNAAWNGNVRELENVMHRVLVLTEQETVTANSLREIHYESEPETSVKNIPLLDWHIDMRTAEGTFRSIDEIERETMQRVLYHYNRNMAQAADALGIARSTFYRKMKQT